MAAKTSSAKEMEVEESDKNQKQFPVENLQDQGFLTFLDSLGEKPATTFRFFNRNDYYTVHGADALFVARDIFKTMSVVKYIRYGSNKTESVCLSKMNFESFVRDLLLVRHYRIEVYKNKASKGNNWVLESKASPGYLTELEDLLFGSGDMTESSGVIAVKLSSESKQQVVGIAYADAVLRRLSVSQFPDDDYYSNLQALIVQLSPKECLIPASENSPQYSKITEIMKKSSILISECKSADFNPKDIVQDLNRLLKFKEGEQGQSAMLSEIDLKAAIGGVAALIKYLELLSDESNFGGYSLTTFDLKQYVRVDFAAVRALGIFPASNEDNKTQNLLGLLNKCRTGPGQRLIAQWIKQPLMDVNKIEERLNIVETFVQDTELRHSLYEDYLRKFPDLQSLSKKFQRKKASLQDCYKVYLVVEQLPYLCKCLDQHKGVYALNIKENFLSPLQELQEDFSKFKEMVETTIDMDQIENGEFLVKADFDSDLKELKEQMKEVEEEIQAQLSKVAKDLGLEAEKTVKLEMYSQLGYCFRVTRKDEKALRKKKNYFTIDTKMNGVRFHNSALRVLNDKYLSVRNDYEQHQKTVVELIIDIAAGYSKPLQILSEVIAQLDVFVALSTAAVSPRKPYVRPKVLEKGSGILYLKQARHPCLEVQDGVDFIPNDVSLEQGKETFCIITGPNMGGKSTYIRSVALNVLMAQIGSFVPCDEATVSVVDAVLTRVGAGDKQLKGVSTFMAEMLESASIMRSSTQDSLIIIDELGRGTSTYDGFGLAWAISEHIAKEIKAYCLFATHFHELTALADEVETVANYHVTAMTSEDSLIFLYRVKQGICDQSFGIHVAEMAHFPKNIIELAKEKVQEFEDFRITFSTTNEHDAKRQKLEYEEAQEIIRDFLTEAKKISCDTLTPEECMARLDELKQKVKARNNSHIEKLLSNCS